MKCLMCEWQKIGTWSDRNHTNLPLMQCSICGQVKHVGKTDKDETLIIEELG